MENNNLENRTEENKKGGMKKYILVLAIFGFAVAGIIAGTYLFLSRDEIYVEKSQIVAPLIGLSSESGGRLEKLYVNPGDKVAGNQVVAEVGQDLIKAKDSGLVVLTENNIGEIFSPGQAVVEIVRPQDLRVVAQVEEDKGLSSIQVGQKAFFTVDAFGSRKFEGLVDEVSPTSRASDVVFNISSQRQVNEFNVKIRFDVDRYPELRNGMSAKSWIYKN